VVLPESLQSYIMILPLLDSLPNPFRFIIHHSTLHSVSTNRAVKHKNEAITPVAASYLIGLLLHHDDRSSFFRNISDVPKYKASDSRNCIIPTCTCEIHIQSIAWYYGCLLACNLVDRNCSPVLQGPWHSERLP
jgi:hypothetical protein